MSSTNEKQELTKKDIENIKNLEVFNPSNFVFYTYFDGVKKEYRYENDISEKLRQVINQYKLYELKIKSAGSNEEKSMSFIEEKKRKYDVLLSKIEEWRKEGKLKLTDYKIIEPKVAVDLAILVDVNGEIKIPLIERKHTPKGFAFPGGFIDEGETPFEAAIREANEEVNFNRDRIEKQQFSSPIFYDGIDKKTNFLCKDGIRDPRSEFNHRNEIQGKISTYFYNVRLTKEQSVKTINELKAGDDAAKVKLYSYKEIMELLENKSFAQGHGELLIKTIMTVPEFLVRFNQKKYNFENKELIEMFEKYKKSENEKKVTIDLEDKCYVPLSPNFN